MDSESKDIQQVAKINDLDPSMVLAADSNKGETGLVMPPAIINFGPISMKSGEDFNLQPNNHSLMWMNVINVTYNTVVLFNDEIIPSTNGKNFLTCSIARQNYQNPGENKIFLFDTKTGLTSNVVIFSVIT